MPEQPEKRERIELTASQNAQIRKAYADLLSGMRIPDLSKILPSVVDIQKSIQPNLDSIARALAPTYNMGIDLSKSLQLNLPKLKVDLPPLQLDYARLFGPALNFENLGLKQIIDSSSTRIFEQIYDAQRKQFERIFESVNKFLEKSLPPNWRGVQGLTQLETILLNEGLALAWVPPSEVLEALIGASSKQERRRILGRRWKRVVAACRESLESASIADYASYRRFAINVVEMLEGGHSAGAQALAANLLDTMLRETLDAPSRQLVTDQRNRLSIDDLPMRAAMVFGGIWGSHTEFWQNRGDSIPREFTRHGSAHGVSRRQYSRINAVIALMHVTAYIMLLESGDLG